MFVVLHSFSWNPTLSEGSNGRSNIEQFQLPSRSTDCGLSWL
jgi:hypothetical protein